MTECPSYPGFVPFGCEYTEAVEYRARLVDPSDPPSKLGIFPLEEIVVTVAGRADTNPERDRGHPRRENENEKCHRALAQRPRERLLTQDPAEPSQAAGASTRVSGVSAMQSASNRSLLGPARVEGARRSRLRRPHQYDSPGLQVDFSLLAYVLFAANTW